MTVRDLIAHLENLGNLDAEVKIVCHIKPTEVSSIQLFGETVLIEILGELSPPLVK